MNNTAIGFSDEGDGTTLDNDVPLHYSVGCAIASLGLMATIVLHWRAMVTLKKSPFSAKRMLYGFILRLAPALAVLNFLSVTSPPMHRVTELLQHMVVAGCMASFMELLLLLLYRTSLAPEGSDESRLPGITNIVERFEMSLEDYNHNGGHYLAGILNVLRQQPAMDVWTSPPLGCCFALCPCLPCAKAYPATLGLLALLRRAVLLYAAGVVLVPFLDMWFDGVPAFQAYRDPAEWCTWLIETAAMLLALYALFIMYRLSHEPLHAYKTTVKFAAIKLTLYFFTLQRIVLVRLCDRMSEANWWHSVAVVAECPILGLLLSYAFPAKELAHRAASSDHEEGAELRRLITEDSAIPTIPESRCSI